MTSSSKVAPVSTISTDPDTESGGLADHEAAFDRALNLAVGFANADADQDGKLDATEMMAAADRDGDGTVTATELGAFAARMGGGRANLSQKLNEATKKLAQEGVVRKSNARRRHRAESIVSTFANEMKAHIQGVSPLIGLDPDVDGDGKVTAFERYVWEELQKADADGDGTLSSKEVYAIVARCCQEKKKTKKLTRMLVGAIAVIIVMFTIMFAGMFIVTTWSAESVKDSEMSGETGFLQPKGSDRIAQVAVAEEYVPLYIAPVMAHEALSHVTHLSVKVGYPYLSNADASVPLPEDTLVEEVTVAYTVTGFVWQSKTKMHFTSTQGDEIHIDGYDAWVVAASGKRYDVCAADATCSSFKASGIDVDAIDAEMDRLDEERASAEAGEHGPSHLRELRESNQSGGSMARWLWRQRRSQARAEERRKLSMTAGGTEERHATGDGHGRSLSSRRPWTRPRRKQPVTRTMLHG